jgi:hypothetical protein
MSAHTAPPENSPMLRAILNLSKFHREHEKFYASSPRELAVALQRHARSLQALADQWTASEPSVPEPFSPYEGAEDLNSAAALQLDGVLFMEGEGRPAEITHLMRDLRTVADDQRGTGQWLASAMQASWDVAAALTSIDGSRCARRAGTDHRHDWQAAGMALLRADSRPGRGHLERVVSHQALRADMAAGKVSAARLSRRPS